jgi:hypothetical protein
MGLLILSVQTLYRLGKSTQNWLYYSPLSVLTRRPNFSPLFSRPHQRSYIELRPGTSHVCDVIARVAQCQWRQCSVTSRHRLRHENPIVGSVLHTRDTTPRNAHQNALISKAINFLTKLSIRIHRPLFKVHVFQKLWKNLQYLVVNAVSNRGSVRFHGKKPLQREQNRWIKSLFF